MNNRIIAVSIVLFLSAVIGMFVFAYLKRSEITGQTPVDTNDVQATDPYRGITRIDAKHFFIDGVHTLTGEILMPTPCDLLDWDVAVQESYPEHVTVRFNVINASETCEQTVTSQRFTVAFNASEKATISMYFMGRPVEFNPIPPGPGETPAEYELFIKG